jgi:hypothetical protein
MLLLAVVVILCTPISFAQTDIATSSDTVSQAVATSTVTTNDSYAREVLPNQEVFNDFVVGPGKIELELAPGQSRTVELAITNRMGEPKRFKLEIEDTAGSSDGTVAVSLLGDQRGPYTLRDYIKISSTEFELEHGVRARVPVTVSLPADAEPGGRYGSVVVSTVSREASIDSGSGAAAASAIVSRIGTLFFITTPGDIARSGALESFSTLGNKTFYAEGPIPFAIVFENTGSVHLNPYGELRIYNIMGDEVGFEALDPWFAMPTSLRLREVSWNRELLMGRYTAVVKINRGYDNQIDEATVVFYVIPWKILVLVFVSFVLLFMILRFIFSRFEFKRKS